MQPSYQPSRYILTTSLSRPIGYFFSVYVIVDNTPLLWYSSEQKISHQNSATWSIYKIVYHIKEIFLHFTDSHNRKKCILFSLPLGKITLMRVYIRFVFIHCSIMFKRFLSPFCWKSLVFFCLSFNFCVFCLFVIRILFLSCCQISHHLTKSSIPVFSCSYTNTTKSSLKSLSWNWLD